MIIVTGAAGFIGSHIVSGLNKENYTDIIAVDDLTDGRKFKNLSVNRLTDYLDCGDFLKKIENNFLFKRSVDAVFRQGASVITTEKNGKQVMSNNYEYSKAILHYCLKQNIPLIYASSAAVYGQSKYSSESSNGTPLNVYAYSKYLFDQYCLPYMTSEFPPIVGLRYFNVYGRRESHKESMASMAWQGMNQLNNHGVVRLFGAHGGCAAGEHARDFIFVADIVRVNLWFLNQPHLHGIFNVGTGQARSFNELAKILIQLQGFGKIEYIEFPESLKESYQHYTCADIRKLRQSGYEAPFHSLEEGLQKYFLALPLEHCNLHED